MKARSATVQPLQPYPAEASYPDRPDTAIAHCAVRRLSVAGAWVDAPLPVRIGDALYLSVRLAPTRAVNLRATVRWRDAASVGVSFDSPRPADVWTILHGDDLPAAMP